MHPTIVFAFLLTGCFSGVDLQKEPSPDSADTGRPDTGQVDTGAADSADSGAVETGNDSGSTDTGTAPDTGVTQPDTTVTYVGMLEGQLSFQGRDGTQTADCRGDVRVVRSPDGTIWGEANCDAGDWNLTGSLDASWSRGSWDGAWAVDVGRDVLDVGMSGTIDDRRLAGDVSYGSDWLAFDGTISADAQ